MRRSLFVIFFISVISLVKPVLASAQLPTTSGFAIDHFVSDKINLMLTPITDYAGSLDADSGEISWRRKDPTKWGHIYITLNDWKVAFLNKDDSVGSMLNIRSVIGHRKGTAVRLDLGSEDGHVLTLDILADGNDKYFLILRVDYACMGYECR